MALVSRRVAVITCVPIGRSLLHLGFALLRLPFRSERIELPTATTTGVDVVEDLVAYTGLDHDQVVALVQRRHENFRTEWHAFPTQLRTEDWFYLASRTYLFGNAEHNGERTALALDPSLPRGSTILDFGGGSGNLALALAARGHRVHYVERSALQKDFVRFRIEKNGLGDRVQVIDQWKQLQPAAYDAVCAIDVFEHIERLPEVLAPLLDAIKPGGLLAENSPFVRNVENPMHHEGEAAFDELMAAAGFRCNDRSAGFRVWTRVSRQSD
jgi:2-polyprenyl-3-methyl-5-hydroxy-6-metoxy-1,4-benzoquinol methylase